MSNITTEEALNLTHQTFFDRVWERAKDPRVSISGDGKCLYRDTVNNVGCFLGCSIPDEKYRPEMENSYEVQNIVHEIFPKLEPYFVFKVFRVHDITSRSFNIVEDRQLELRDIARIYGLTISGE